MDAQQLAELRRWAARLTTAPAPELRAAGRAIELLAGEVERLRAELERRGPGDGGEGQPPAPDRPDARSLRAALGRRHVVPELRPRRPDGDEERQTSAAPEPELPPAPEPELPPAREPELPAAPARPGAPDHGVGPVTRPARARPRRRRRRRRRVTLSPARLRTALAVAVALGLVTAGIAFGSRLAAPDLDPSGPPPDARIGAAAARALAFGVRADAGTLRRARWELDGRDVTARVANAGRVATFDGRTLPDGPHILTVSASGPFPGAGARRTWRFTIDRTGPRIRLEAPSLRAVPGAPATVKGSVERGASLRVAGRAVPVRRGRFAVRFAEPPERAVPLAATDAFGNTTRTRVRVTLVPRRPPAPVRGVHVTFAAWADRDLRAGVLRLLEQGRINTVELDLKDESGTVGFDARIPLGRRIGAIDPIVDLPRAIRQLHARGAWVVGRIVAFRDPIHAREAWKRGWRAQVVQTPGGGPYAGYGGFTNFGSPAVRQYNIDVALAAAEAGIDDVLYDYVRRPDGPLSSMVFPGLTGTPEASIASFLGEARRQLRPYRVFLGASVFGVAATRPLEIAQDIPAIGRNVDYVAPMVYPSHWGPGEYGVAYPNGQPYDIVARSLRDFLREVRGTGARVVPWLQDFTLGVGYGPAEVRAQIEAARDVGIPEWLLWDPLVTYTAEALAPGARPRPLPTRRPLGRGPKGTPRRGSPEAAQATDVQSNELGEIPVLMYHQVRRDGGGPYDVTPAQFRAELERLYREGYRPIRAVDLAEGRIDVPAGATPVVLTFDDSTREQLAMGPGGRPRAGTAVGILLDVARRHRDFRAVGTFYVNREPFGGVAGGDELLRWLAGKGFELGNHTRDHVGLDELPPVEARRQLALGAKLIRDAVPGARVRTLALPLGAMPRPPSLARLGEWNGIRYDHAGVFLVGAEPAPSPFSTRFRPGAIPRIRTAPPGERDGDYGSTFWLDELRRSPGRRYVSDGNPETIAFPAARGGELAPRFRGRAKPY